jgi:hypothetical protein
MVFGSGGGKIEGGKPIERIRGAATGQSDILTKRPGQNAINSHNNKTMPFSPTPEHPQPA